LDDTGKSPWQLLEHCDSTAIAFHAGNNSRGSMASEGAEASTVVQITVAIRMFMIASLARLL
jgi:hypothetical protein